MGKQLIVIVLSVVMAVIPCCVSVRADEPGYVSGVRWTSKRYTQAYAGNNFNEYYKSPGNEATKNFYNYKNNNKSFNEFTYLITKCFYSTVEGSTSINIAYVAI